MKRYSVTVDAYLYAENDQEAKVKAAKLVEFMRTLNDNDAQVLTLEETPFARASRKVHKGRLNLFEGELYEG